MSSVREVLPGRDYFIPDTMEKADPLTISEAEFHTLLRAKPMPVSKAIYTSFTGISPVTAEEICFLSGIDSRLPASELSADVCVHFYNQFCIYLSAVREGQFSPSVYYDGKEPKEFSSLALEHLHTYHRETFSSISHVLETYYATKTRSHVSARIC